MHETFPSGVHTYVCMYVCRVIHTYIVHTYIHTYIKGKKSHLIAPLVMYHSWFQSWENQNHTFYTKHSTLRKRVHPRPSFSFRLIISLNYHLSHRTSPQKRQMAPKRKKKKKKKKKNLPGYYFAERWGIP